MQTGKTGKPARTQAATYVVQITKRSDPSSTELAGVVEDISSGLVAHFYCAEDLVRFLTGGNEKAKEPQS